MGCVSDVPARDFARNPTPIRCAVAGFIYLCCMLVAKLAVRLLWLGLTRFLFKQTSTTKSLSKSAGRPPPPPLPTQQVVKSPEHSAAEQHARPLLNRPKYIRETQTTHK